MTIAARKITTFAKTIAALADAPALGSSALLKAWFDSSPEELRVEINGVIDDLLAVAAGASGADNIGSGPITGVSGATVYAQLASLKSLLDANATADALKAPLNAPALVNPTVTTQATSDNSTKAASTAFVKSLTNLSGSGSPIGVVTPTVVGQLYTDTNTGIVYTATALTNTSWVASIPYNAMTQQAIINAALEIWQQGTSFTNPANNAYTADMWLLNNSSSGTLPTTIVHSQATLTAGELFNSKYAYNINVNGSGSGFSSIDVYGVKQRIEFGTSKLCGNGKKVTVSFYAKSNIAGKRIAVGLTQSYGTGGSPSAVDTCTPSAISIRTLTSSMALYTFTFTTATLTGKTFGTNNDDNLSVNINIMWGSSTASNNFGGGTAETFVGAGDVSFTEVVVNAGDVALPYQPKSYADELAACLRYLEIVDKGLTGQATTTTSIDYVFVFKAAKRVNPALTCIKAAHGYFAFGSSTVNSSGSAVTVNLTTIYGCYFVCSGYATGVGTRYAINDTNVFMADARL